MGSGFIWGATGRVAVTNFHCVPSLSTNGRNKVRASTSAPRAQHSFIGTVSLVHCGTTNCQKYDGRLGWSKDRCVSRDRNISKQRPSKPCAQGITKVGLGDQLYDCEVLGGDASHDLAVLEINGLPAGGLPGLKVLSICKCT